MKCPERMLSILAPCLFIAWRLHPSSFLPHSHSRWKSEHPGQEAVCLGARIPEALAQGDSFPGGSQFLCTLSSHMPMAELTLFLSSSKLAAWNALGVPVLAILTLGRASVGKSQVDAI